MNVIQPAVETETMNVSRIRTVVSQFANRSVDLFVVGYERAAITKRAKIFLNDETRRRGVAQFRNFESVTMRADPLRIILNNEQLVFFGNFADRLHISALAIEMNRDNRLCLPGDGSFDLFRVNAFRLRIAIHKNRRRPAIQMASAVAKNVFG